MKQFWSRKSRALKAKRPDLFGRVREIIESARAGAARTVNTAQVVSNWLIGREIVEDEQNSKERAGYGERLMQALPERLGREFGSGFSLANLKLFRQFYLGYRGLSGPGKGYALRSLFRRGAPAADLEKGHALSDQSWRPGRLHQNLSWTHYRALLHVEDLRARAFYEIEAIQNGWSARELERQIASLLFERLALSRDKKGLMRLALKGQEVQNPADVFKDPMVMEFLGLPESPRLVESKLEEALIGNLQSFLLELGKGFAFVSRQERLTLDGDHFYVDLVFYHAVLKCYVIIDLKTGKLTHQDLGQMQLYVNYYDRERSLGAGSLSESTGVVIVWKKSLFLGPRH